MRRLKRHLFLYPDTFGAVTAYDLLGKIKRVYGCLCQSACFEAVTESECGLQDCFTNLLHVERIVSGVDEGVDAHLIATWQFLGLDPDQMIGGEDFEDEEELEEMLPEERLPESESFDSGEDSDFVEALDEGTEGGGEDTEEYSDGTELEEMVM